MQQMVRENNVFCITNQGLNEPKRYDKDGIHYITVRPRLFQRVSEYIKHGNTSYQLRQKLKNFAVFLNRIKLMLTLPMWPLISPLYTRRVIRAALNLCKETQVDCVVSIYTQIDTLIAGFKLKEKYSSMQFIPCFLDSLSGGYGPRIFSEKQTRERGLKWENRILPSADHIIMMESSREHHKRYSSDFEYYSRMAFLDLPLLQIDAAKKCICAGLMDHTKYNFLYVGTLPSGIRSPSFLLKIISSIQNDAYHFYFVGTDTCEELNDAAGEDSRISVIGRVSHEIALQFECEADILINIGNVNINMAPSKLFEYISFGKPIISTASSNADPCIEYLKDYPLALILPEEKAELKCVENQIGEFVANACGKTVKSEVIQNAYRWNDPSVYSRSIVQWVGEHYESTSN